MLWERGDQVNSDDEKGASSPREARLAPLEKRLRSFPVVGAVGGLVSEGLDPLERLRAEGEGPGREAELFLDDGQFIYTVKLALTFLSDELR